MKKVIAFCMVAMLSACASISSIDAISAVETGFKVGNMTVAAYCKLSPESRAAVRKKYDIPHLIQCPNDPPTEAMPPNDPG